MQIDITSGEENISKLGQEMHDFAQELYPICRSLTGNGVRQTLRMIQEYLPGLQIHEVPSGCRVMDWTIPDEWNIRGARLSGPDGEIIADFAQHNLHVLGYSEPVDLTLPLEELQKNLYSLPHLPDAIPYVTSYYRRRWGFCLSHKQREALKPGLYHARIDSTLEPGHLTYGELILPGETDEEIFLSTYVCHPSMANNELSGPVVTTWLAKWLSKTKRRYTYRIVFIPETIGSITYTSRHLAHLQTHVKAAFNITCVGDDRAYSYLPSRHGNTLSDRLARHMLRHTVGDFVSYSFLDRGSDERQYCAPGVDLPVCSIMRTKYTEYPEYHTSLDDLTLVTPTGLSGAYHVLHRCLRTLEQNYYWKVSVLCEPQLGKRGLYPTISTPGGDLSVRRMEHFIAYADGTRDVIDIGEVIGANALECAGLGLKLEEHGLVHRVAPPPGRI